MTARRFRAVPSAAPRGMQIGVTMTPTGAGSLSPAQIAAERARLNAIDVASCKSPTTMRWRFYPDYVDPWTSETTPGSDPPEWPYEFTPFNPAEVLAGDDGDDYATWTESEITIPIDEDGVPQVIGLLIVDFVDADGRTILCRNNVRNGCSPSDTEPAAIQWAATFVQSEAGYALRSLPNAYPDADNRMVFATNAFESLIPGVLTITATDNWSAGGPYTFGPLTITFEVP